MQRTKKNRKTFYYFVKQNLYFLFHRKVTSLTFKATFWEQNLLNSSKINVKQEKLRRKILK